MRPFLLAVLFAYTMRLFRFDLACDMQMLNVDHINIVGKFFILLSRSSLYKIYHHINNINDSKCIFFFFHFESEFQIITNTTTNWVWETFGSYSLSRAKIFNFSTFLKVKDIIIIVFNHSTNQSTSLVNQFNHKSVRFQILSAIVPH